MNQPTKSFSATSQNARSANSVELYARDQAELRRKLATLEHALGVRRGVLLAVRPHPAGAGIGPCGATVDYRVPVYPSGD